MKVPVALLSEMVLPQVTAPFAVSVYVLRSRVLPDVRVSVPFTVAVVAGANKDRVTVLVPESVRLLKVVALVPPIDCPDLPFKMTSIRGVTVVPVPGVNVPL